jgi:dolichyl-phosphate-mannose--protein O-mannosyl transferase
VKAIQLKGDIDENHRLRAEVPESFPSGPVQLIVLIPDEDDAGAGWMLGIAKEWSELSNSKEDIYTVEDGQPLNAAR